MWKSIPISYGYLTSKTDFDVKNVTIKKNNNKIEVVENKNQSNNDIYLLLITLQHTNEGHRMASLFNVLYACIKLKNIIGDVKILFLSPMTKNDNNIFEIDYFKSLIFNVDNNKCYNVNQLMCKFDFTYLYYTMGIYHIRSIINKYVDESIHNKTYTDKIMIVKEFETTSRFNGVFDDHETIKLIVNEKKYEQINVYNENYLDILRKIRCAKKIIISYGTALYIHMPFFRKNQEIFVINHKKSAELCNTAGDPEYNICSEYYMCFLEKTNYKLLYSDEVKDNLHLL